MLGWQPDQKFVYLSVYRGMNLARFPEQKLVSRESAPSGRPIDASSLGRRLAVAPFTGRNQGSDPDDSEKLFLGHPYRRWSTFWSSSTLEELLRTKARIFIAQGTADENVSVTSFDVLYASLLAHSREVTARRIAGADHGFGFADQPGRDGWKEIFEYVRNWFFQ